MQRGVPILLAMALLSACGGQSVPALSATARDVAKPGTPLIVVDAERVSLDGATVADARSIDGGGRVKRVDELFSRLNERRKQQERSGAAAPSEQWIDARKAGNLSALSAMTTAAFAGYTKVHVQTDTGFIDGKYELPIPPSDETIRARLSVQLSAEDAGVGWHSERPCGGVPESQRVRRSDLGGVVDAVCAKLGEPCFESAHVAFDPRLPFSDVISAIAAVRRHGSETFSFSLRRIDESSRQAQMPKRICERPIYRNAAGGIPHDEVQKVLRAITPKVRACYQQGLDRDRKLAGKVVVAADIDEEGHVETATLVESKPGTESAQAQGTTLPDPAVNACIIESIRSSVFPKPRAGGRTTVVFPYVFKNED